MTRARAASASKRCSNWPGRHMRAMRSSRSSASGRPLLVIDMPDEFVRPHWTPFCVPDATRLVPGSDGSSTPFAGSRFQCSTPPSRERTVTQTVREAGRACPTATARSPRTQSGPRREDLARAGAGGGRDRHPQAVVRGVLRHAASDDPDEPGPRHDLDLRHADQLLLRNHRLARVTSAASTSSWSAI
jgi:hypothetical protein